MSSLGHDKIKFLDGVQLLIDLGIADEYEITPKGRLFITDEEIEGNSILEWCIHWRHHGHGWVLLLIYLSLSIPEIIPHRIFLSPPNLTLENAVLGIPERSFELFESSTGYDPELLRWSLLAGIPHPPPFEEFKSSMRTIKRIEIHEGTPLAMIHLGVLPQAVAQAILGRGSLLENLEKAPNLS